MIARLLRFATSLAVALPAAGWACSPAPGNRLPTNFELVQRADLIAIVQVDSGPEGSIAAAERADHFVRIGPMQVLKGVLPREPLTLEGIVSRGDGKAFESMPTPLGTPHFSTHAGACARRYFAKGGLILAMYERTGDGLRPISAPFARALEDVESYDSLWVRTARLYVELQQRGRGEALRGAVIAERDRLRALTSDMEAQAIAADLDLWLEGRARGIVGWQFDDGTDRARVFVNAVTGRERAVLSCRRNGAAIELAGGRTLTIAGRSFAAENGRIGFTPELRHLLEHSAGPFTVGPHRGGAGDVFQKFAMRCETLLEP
jgi:hypothetical protein